MLSNLIKKSKQSYYTRKFENASGDPKKTWVAINELRGKTKTALPAYFKIDNRIVTDKQIIANKFNEHFCSLAEKLNKYVNHTTRSNFQDYLGAPEQSSIFLEDTTVDEVYEIIKEFKNDKSSNIPICVIKHCAPIISPILSNLYNKHMRLGKFPDMLKTGRVTPIYKKAEVDCIANYRPISTLPILGKIFERVIYTRLYSFVSSRNILSDTQFGFRKQHCTSHAIHHSVNFIKKSHSKSMNVLGISIDLSKAFDHTILLKKLNPYGVRGISHKLISSYLKNRFQHVKINDYESDKLEIKYGVPQGSILGALLFLLYINKLTSAIKKNMNCEIILYADDINIFVACDSLKNGQKFANEILDKLSDFMLCNLLHVNLDKSCFMYFTSSRKPINLNKNAQGKHNYHTVQNEIKLFIGRNQIKEVTDTKFLGIQFDPMLNWSTH